MKMTGVVTIVLAVVLGTIAGRYADRLFPTLTQPPGALKKIF